LTTAPVAISAWRILLLQPPPAFGTYPHPNLPMWTIAYEFRCYLLVALLCETGWLWRRPAILWLTAVSAALFLFANHPSILWHLQDMEVPMPMVVAIGHPWLTFRLVMVFAIGAAFNLCRHVFAERVNGRIALFGLFCVILCLCHTPIAEPGLLLFGGFPLFWLAFKAKLGWLGRINSRHDISYGTYLYGYPISFALKYWQPDMGLLPFTLASLVLAGLCGALSWFGLEMWMPGLLRRLRSWDGRRRAVATP
ncbi:MAG: acyltransferase, partial [Rhizorhabdus sp.]|nr:acyltransferase [Rhizorhabdus sp.]